MTIQLQLLTENQIDTVLPLVAAYHEFESLETTEIERTSAIRKLISDHNLGGIWLIYSEEELAGYIALCRGFSIEFGGFDAFVDEFYLLPKFRGQGIGAETLEQIKAEASKMDIEALHLEVARANTRAQKLYAKAQFKPRDKYVLMTVQLSPSS